jgi:hypothetical protein
MLDENGVIITSDTLRVHPRMKELYKFFKFNGKVVDITNFNPENLQVFSREVLKMIGENKPGWESMLPSGVAEIIKKHQLFGYNPSKLLENSN